MIETNASLLANTLLMIVLIVAVGYGIRPHVTRPGEALTVWEALRRLSVVRDRR